MKDVIGKIQYLKQKYPTIIKTFAPAPETKIENVQKILGINLPEHLKEIYRYTDGLGVIDYGMISIDPKKRRKLSDGENLESVKEFKRLEIISTSVGKAFWLKLAEDSKEDIWFTDESDSTSLLVATSVHDFFMQFLDKVDILCAHFDPKEYVAYFEDDNMPAGLSTWR